MHEPIHTSLPDPTEPRSVKVRLQQVRVHAGKSGTTWISFQWHIVGTKNWIHTGVPLERPGTRWGIREHAEALKKWYDPYPDTEDLEAYFQQFVGKECYGTLRWHSPWWDLKSLRHKRTGLFNYPEDR